MPEPMSRNWVMPKRERWRTACWPAGKHSLVLLQRDGALADQFEDPAVLFDLVLLLKVERADVGLQVDDVGIVGVAEVKDPEGACHRRVRTGGEGQHPDVDGAAMAKLVQLL